MITRLSHTGGNCFLLLDKAFDSSLGNINNFVFIAKKNNKKQKKNKKTRMVHHFVQLIHPLNHSALNHIISWICLHCKKCDSNGLVRPFVSDQLFWNFSVIVQAETVQINSNCYQITICQTLGISPLCLLALVTRHYPWQVKHERCYNP